MFFWCYYLVFPCFLGFYLSSFYLGVSQCASSNHSYRNFWSYKECANFQFLWRHLPFRFSVTESFLAIIPVTPVIVVVLLRQGRRHIQLSLYLSQFCWISWCPSCVSTVIIWRNKLFFICKKGMVIKMACS